VQKEGEEEEDWIEMQAIVECSVTRTQTSLQQ
jgi:hypothetical protein